MSAEPVFHVTFQLPTGCEIAVKTKYPPIYTFAVKGLDKALALAESVGVAQSELIQQIEAFDTSSVKP